MSETKAVRLLGLAEYEARWIHITFMVKLTAKGTLPCFNYEAQLEQRPERVLPPMWDMLFYVEPVCEKALRPFEKEVVIF